MEFTENKKKQLNDMPIIENKITLSKDKKYVIHKTIITDIKPISYYDKVLSGENSYDN